MKSFFITVYFLILINISYGQRINYFQFEFEKTKTQLDLPISFDLRNSAILSHVKTQFTGGCWAASAMTTVESRYQKTYHKNVVLSDANLLNCHEFDSLRSNYGNQHMVSAYFSSGRGPLLKNNINDSVCSNTLSPAIYIPEARYLSDNPSLIKRILFTEGPVFSMMYYKSQFLDTLNNIYFSNINKVNHTVSLVGWNDTTSTKWGKGVWIAQNSLGEKVGDSGFLYIAFQDSSILQYNAFWPVMEKSDPLRKIYYYDTLGSYYSFGFKDTVCSGLTKFIAESDIRIEAISTAINYPGTIVDISIYDDFINDSTLAKLIYQFESIACEFSGYYSFKPAKEIRINQQDDFYVMITYRHPNEQKPLPIECYIEGYSNPHLTENKCWVNPDFNKWPYTWYLCGAKSKWPSLKFDLNIKVVAKVVE